MADSEFAILGGGCFWCLESVFTRIPGILKVQSGYAGGHLDNPTYEQVCSGQTGHAEVIRIEFNPDEISYMQILDLFWKVHDPTQLNRQGADTGTQYRSVIFHLDQHQQMVADASITALKASGAFPNPIVTEVSPAPTFYEAEPYHQSYFENNPGNPYCMLTIPPKLEKLGLS